MKRSQKIGAGPTPLIWTKSKGAAVFSRETVPNEDLVIALLEVDMRVGVTAIWFSVPGAMWNLEPGEERVNRADDALKLW